MTIPDWLWKGIPSMRNERRRVPDDAERCAGNSEDRTFKRDNILYVPLEAVEKALSYTGEWDVEENTLSLLLQAAKREAFHSL